MHLVDYNMGSEQSSWRRLPLSRILKNKHKEYILSKGKIWNNYSMSQTMVFKNYFKSLICVPKPHLQPEMFVSFGLEWIPRTYILLSFPGNSVWDTLVSNIEQRFSIHRLNL